MTLQQPLLPNGHIFAHRQSILCHKCGAPITFSKDQIGLKGKKVPLDPYFNNEPHAQHCMYPDVYDTDTELMLFDFLSMIPKYRQRRVIGAVGGAK